jgi:putative oxidoreductase
MTNSTEIARFEPILLAALRIVAGVLFLSHGLVKLFGFPPGAAPGQQELLSVMGIGAVIETVAGTLIALGLFTRAAASSPPARWRSATGCSTRPKACARR